MHFLKATNRSKCHTVAMQMRYVFTEINNIEKTHTNYLEKQNKDKFSSPFKVKQNARHRLHALKQTKIMYYLQH